MHDSPWRHFALLLGLAVVGFYLLDLLSLTQVNAAGAGSAIANAAWELPATLYKVLPAVAALSVGAMRIDRRSIRTAAVLAGAVMVGMLLLDLVRSPAPVGPSAAHSIIETRGYVRGASFALAHPGEIGQLLKAYPMNHARPLATQSLIGLALLLLPGILVGLVLGVGAWIRDRVLFRTTRDEVVARWVIAWLLVPGAWAFIGNWSLGYLTRILFRGQPIWLVLVPYAPAILLAIIGWRRASRAARELATPEPVAASEGR